MRIAVFIDWENVTRTARRAFHPHQQKLPDLDPLKIGETLIQGHDCRSTGNLVSVEVHRGLPSPRKQPKSYTKTRSTARTWQKETKGLVTPKLRPLRYRKNHDGLVRGEEKGVDVQLAVSAIRWILKDECDIAILFSHDSDFSPVVEMLAETEGPHCIETASWYSKNHRQRVPNHAEVYNHFLNHADYLTLTQQQPTS